jgi:hypothetical protein
VGQTGPIVGGRFQGSLTEWWTEGAEFPNLIDQLLNDCRPDQAEDFMARGTEYNSADNGFQILEGLRFAAETVGPENVDSQAIYEAMSSVKMVWDDLQRQSYGPEKRVSADFLAIYEVDGPTRNLIRVSDWLPVESGPE